MRRGCSPPNADVADGARWRTCYTSLHHLLFRPEIGAELMAGNLTVGDLLNRSAPIGGNLLAPALQDLIDRGLRLADGTRKIRLIVEHFPHDRAQDFDA